MKHAVNVQNREFGGAGVKFTMVIVVLFLLAHAGFNYVPVAYEGESFKQEMQTAVVNGFATARGKPEDYVKAKLQKTIEAYDLPDDTVLEVQRTGNVISAHAAYSKKVGILPFGMYDYVYEFDQTATPTGYLLKQ